MEFDIIESGSKGNATLIFSRGRVILIDMGITLKSLKCALSNRKLNLMNINALFLTHSHSDHTSGVKYLDPLPIYCTEGTYDGINVIYIDYFQTIEIGDLKIKCIPTSHDAVKSCGFIIENGNEKLTYITDTGMIFDEVIEEIKNSDYYIIESNHNVKMLHKTNRPVALKLRILSDEGHLSNEESALYMSQVVGEKTKQIFLAHLSQEANTPELALKAYEKIFNKKKISLDKISIIAASQNYLVSGGNKNEL